MDGRTGVTVIDEENGDSSFRDLVEDLDAVVWEADPDTFDFSFVNRRAVELLGYRREEWYESEFWCNRLIHPEDRAHTVSACRNAVQERRDHEIDYRAVAADGRIVWLRDRIRIVLNAEGRVATLRGIMLDVTAEKAIEAELERERLQLQKLTDEQGQTLAALRATQERFDLLAEHVPQVFWIAAPDGTPVYVSPAYEKIWGRPLETFDAWAASLHPDDREYATSRYKASGSMRELEYRIVRPDGEERWILDRAYPLREPDDSIRLIVGTAEDITDSKLANDRLAAAEAHYRRLVRTSPYAVCVTDTEGRFLELNPAAEQILGRSVEWLLGRHFNEIIAEGSTQEASENFMMVLTGEADRVNMELPLQHASGEVRLVSIAATPIELDGVRTGVHGIARDITEERERDAQRRMLEATLDALPDAVSVMGPDGLFRYRNRVHAELLGYDPAAGPPGFEDLLPDDEAREQVAEIRAALRQHRRWSGRVRRLRGDGSIALLALTVFAVREEDGDDVTLSVIRDASEDIEREQHLRRVERLASLGTLIGGVAHELNNPLTAVVGFAHLMLLDERPAEDRETLETMAREAERAARIVADLRSVARGTQRQSLGTRESVDMNDVVRHVIKVRRHALETRSIELTEEFADDLPLVWGNRTQLEQVVLNLVVNAEQALIPTTNRPRTLVVRTRRSTLGAALHVIDNGTGILREHLDRVFDPFFTTRPPGEGTGLGLSLVHSIVTEHGGGMRVDSAPDRGSEFVIDLPEMDEAAVQDSTTSPS